MFKTGDRVKIVKMIILPRDKLVGLKKAHLCLGKEGKIRTVYPDNALAYYVKMDDSELGSSFWREEELERV